MTPKQITHAKDNNSKLIGYRRAASLVLAIVGALVIMLAPQFVGAQGRSFAPAVLASNDCTITVSTGQSISDAINAAPRGAIICVRAGVYNEQVRLGPDQSGLTVKAYPGERPVLDGQQRLPTKSNNGLINIVSTNNITVDGFEVRNSAGRGVVVGNTEDSTIDTHHIVVRNLTVHHSQDHGILVRGNSRLGTANILIANNIVYENLQKNITTHLGGSGIVFVETRDSVARGNTVYNNYGEGIVAGRYSVNTVLEGNVSYDNARPNIYVLNTIDPVIDGNFVFCTDDRAFWNSTNRSGILKAGIGLELRDESFPNAETQPHRSHGQVILNNVVVGCSANFSVATQVPGGGLVDAVVANNTFANARGDDGTGVNNIRWEGRASFQNSLFVNNVIVQTTPGAIASVLLSLGTPDFSTFTVANNLYWPSPSSGWFANEPRRLVADPLLANLVVPRLPNLPDPRWYALTANSPAINSGQAVAQVVTDFFNNPRSNPPDRGAIEFSAAAGTGRIQVVAEATPPGAAPLFSFTASFPPTGFQLGVGQTHDSGPLTAGTYNVTMTPLPGWTLTSATCDDGSDPAAIELAAGETVTCAFATAQDALSPGTILVRKETDPTGSPEAFTFSTNYGGDFQLSDGGIHTSGALSPGIYSVAETPLSGWTLTSTTCSDGSPPAAIDLGAGETVTCTSRSKKDARSTAADVLYISARQSGKIGGLSYAYNDVLAYDFATGRWSLHLDLSDVGFFRNINAFTMMDDGSVLLSVLRNQSFSGLGTVTPRDIIRFVPQSTGPTTKGTWQWYLDGSDVGLTTSNETIDAVALAPDGRLLISTIGTAVAPAAGGTVRAADEDLLAFSPTSLGANTAGTWSLYFDGSTVQGLAVEDVNGAWLDKANSDLYLTVTNSFSIGGVTGSGRDIIRLQPIAGGYQVQKYWSGPDHGFTGPPSDFAIKR